MRRKGFVLLAALLAFAVTPVLWAFFVEPLRVETTQHELTVVGLRQPLTVVHLTDLHLNSEKLGWREEKTISEVQTARPDLIVITGDWVNRREGYAGLAAFIKRLKAPLEIWVTRGNWDHWVRHEEERSVIESAGARLLVNENARVREDVWLIGLDDFFAGKPDVEAATRGVDPAVFKLGLIHSPEQFDHLEDRFEVVLGGHTHAGRIRMPLIGALWLPPGSGRFEWGWYESASGKSRLYVSRGIGNSMIEARFLCRPEVAVHILRPLGPLQ